MVLLEHDIDFLNVLCCIIISVTSHQLDKDGYVNSRGGGVIV